MKVIFYSHVNKTHFHKNGFALSLVFWEFFELGNRLSFCDVPHGNTDMNFVDFGKAHLPFLFYFGSYSFNRSSAMSVIVFSKIQVTYKPSGHLHSFIWILHKQWNVDYLTKNAVSFKQSPRRFPVKTLRCSTPSISNTARLRLQNTFSFDLFCILNPSMLVKLGYKSSQNNN